MKHDVSMCMSAPLSQSRLAEFCMNVRLSGMCEWLQLSALDRLTLDCTFVLTSIPPQLFTAHFDTMFANLK